MNAQPPEESREPPSGIREIRSEQLLQGDRMVIITHGDQRYRLILTRNGKLILQK